MIVVQEERWLEELSYQLQLPNEITASGATMTVPAATSDLRDWIDDTRIFLSVQHDDWQQVIGDFRDSLQRTGAKLLAVVGARRQAIDRLLTALISTTVIDGVMRHFIDATVRSQLGAALDDLTEILRTDDALVAAWRDLVKGCQALSRTCEEASFRRDTLWAIAKNRRLNLGHFGFHGTLTAILSNDPYTIEREQARIAGETYRFARSEKETAGLADWERLALCEKVMVRPAARGDCVVWLRLEPASLARQEVSHGQVTFYQAAWLFAHAGHPEFADRFTTPPVEVLAAPDPRSPEDDIEWEHKWDMVYARIALGESEIHSAEDKARTLVEGIRAVNHVDDDTWVILRGNLVYVDGRCRQRSWGPKSQDPPHFYPQNDWMGRDIGLMVKAGKSLDTSAGHALHNAIAMSTALKAAAKESPEATVMAAVRAIEHVNSWTTGGRQTWTDFAATYFKRADSRIRVAQFLRYFTQTAVDNVPDRRPSARTPPELNRLRSALYSWKWPDHRRFHTRVAVDHIATLQHIYQDHWLVRGLQELEHIFSTGDALAARLEMHGRRFESHLRRMRRLRNAAIHGGPISETAAISVNAFAQNLAHQCLNEAITAMLTGSDVAAHLAAFRADTNERFNRIRTSLDVEALFIDPVDEDDEDDAP